MAMYNEIIDIMKTKYNFDPGGIPTALDSYDTPLLIKFDVESEIIFNVITIFLHLPTQENLNLISIYERGYELHNVNFKLDLLTIVLMEI